MTLRNDQLSKIYGILEPTEPFDPAVHGRLKFHEAAVKWCAKWLTTLHVFFALIGFAVVLLPLLVQVWRAVVESIPFLAIVFHDYSTLSGWSLLNLLAGMLTAFAKTYLNKYSPGSSLLSCEEIIWLAAYPRTKKEEAAFWIDIAGTILVSTIWLFLPFGVLAFVIRTVN
jgi:hypothetical protein